MHDSERSNYTAHTIIRGSRATSRAIGLYITAARMRTDSLLPHQHRHARRQPRQWRHHHRLQSEAAAMRRVVLVVVFTMVM